MVVRVLIKAARKIHFSVLNAQRALLIIIFVPLTLAMFAETFARYVIGKGFFAIEDFIGYTAVTLYFIGASYATYERTHIKAEVTTMFVKNQRTLSIIRAGVAAFSVAVACLFVYWAYGLIAFSIASDYRTPVYQVPFVIFQMAILVGAVLMAIYFIAEMVDRIRDVRRTPLSSQGKEA